MIGNGFCNTEVNNADCGYDGGDCCLYPGLVGDGICNDETNNLVCNYDGGDCCKSNMVSDYCLECKCYQPETCHLLKTAECMIEQSGNHGYITSPRFPSNYYNNINWTWLIKLEQYQFIKIGFIVLDLESHSNCR